MALKHRLVGILIMFGIFAESRMKILEPSFEEDLSRFVELTMNCRHVPGLTLSIVKGDETWARGYGFADLTDQRMVNNSTLFNIGSVTKSFTMVVLGILLEEKGMDWSTKVSEILDPDYEFVDEYRTQETTIRDLLSHRTGLAQLDLGIIAGYPVENFTRETYCKKLKYLPQLFSFRDQFLYNNHMYTMLAHIAEKLGGASWEELVTSRIFEPIGMTSSRILKDPTDVLEPDMAHPIIYKDGMYQNGTLDLYSLYPLEPAGAILSNGEDMSKYMRFYLKKGMTEDGKQLIDKDMFLKAWKTTTATSTDSFLRTTFLTEPDFPVSDVTMGYGYAWFTSSYRGNERLWHSGGFHSYITYVWLFPDVNVGLFVSANGPAFKSFTGNAEKSILYHLADYMLGKTAWISETTTCDFPDLWRHKPTNSTPDETSVSLTSPAEYVGVYGSHFLPTMKVSTNPSNDTSLKFEMNRIGGLLHSTQDKDRFLMEITWPWEIMTSFSDGNNVTMKSNVTFKRSHGEVDSVELQFEVKVLYKKGVDVSDVDVNTQTSRTATLTGNSQYAFFSLSLLIFAIVLMK